MKENKMVNYSLVAKELMDHSKGSFMRKGEALSSYKNVHIELKLAIQLTDWQAVVLFKMFLMLVLFKL